MKKLNTISQNFKVVALLLTLMSGHLVFAKCLTPPVSVFKWFETDGLISQRRDWLIGFKV